MALTKRRPSRATRGSSQSRAGIDIGSDVIVFQGSAAPSNGVTGAGSAGPGSIYIRAAGASSKAYINTNTLASPTWTVIGSQS